MISGPLLRVNREIGCPGFFAAAVHNFFFFTEDTPPGNPPLDALEETNTSDPCRVDPHYRDSACLESARLFDILFSPFFVKPLSGRSKSAPSVSFLRGAC